MNAFNRVREKVWKQQPEEFFDCAIIEGDGTQIETSAEKKQGIGINYKGQWGYHPLIITLANTREHSRTVVHRQAEEQAFFRRFESAFHENFTFVSSSGKEFDRVEFLEHLRQLEGQSVTTRIWAENIRTFCSSGSSLVVRFDEHEDDKQIVRSRVSTVVFEVNDSMPNRLCWIRLHETRKKDET